MLVFGQLLPIGRFIRLDELRLVVGGVDCCFEVVVVVHDHGCVLVVVLVVLVLVVVRLRVPFHVGIVMVKMVAGRVVKIVVMLIMIVAAHMTVEERRIRVMLLLLVVGVHVWIEHGCLLLGVDLRELVGH